MKYIDWDNSDEEYQSDRDFWADVTYSHNLKDLKKSLADLKKPFCGYFDTDEEDEAQRERNHKYEWDATHGLI